MLRASLWQLQRAHEKEHAQTTYERAQRSEIVKVDGSVPAPEVLMYRQVILEGRYLKENQFLLDNSVLTGENGLAQVGYDVITPFRLDNGVLVLVNRGWVSAGLSRNQLPKTPVEENLRTIHGTAVPPSRGFRLGAMDADLGWPRVIQYVDLDEIAKRLEKNIYPLLVMLSAGETDGYPSDWQPVIEGPHKHYSYALQWLLMAVAVIILFFVFSKSKKD